MQSYAKSRKDYKNATGLEKFSITFDANQAADQPVLGYTYRLKFTVTSV